MELFNVQSKDDMPNTCFTSWAIRNDVVNIIKARKAYDLEVLYCISPCSTVKMNNSRIWLAYVLLFVQIGILLLPYLTVQKKEKDGESRVLQVLITRSYVFCNLLYLIVARPLAHFKQRVACVASAGFLADVHAATICTEILSWWKTAANHDISQIAIVINLKSTKRLVLLSVGEFSWYYNWIVHRCHPCNAKNCSGTTWL